MSKKVRASGSKHPIRRREGGRNPHDDAQIRQTLAELERQVQSAEKDGNRPQAFVGRQAKALLYTASQEWTAAAREYDRAAQLAAAEEQRFPEAQGRFGQGLALEQLPQQRKAAQATFRRAAELYLETGHLDKMVEACQHLAASYAQAGELERAVMEMTVPLEHLDEATHPHLLIAVYGSRAQLHMLQALMVPQEGLSEEGVRLALADLDEALRIAQKSGDSQTTLEIRAQRRAIQGSLGDEAQMEDLPSLLQVSLDMGKLDTLGNIYLQSAQEFIQQGQFEQAIDAAQAARQAALESDDLGRYIRYLMACLFIASAREALDDRPGVIAVLLTCKKTLESDLGKEVGQQANHLLDSLADRWGREGLMEALNAYRQQVAANEV